MEKVQYFSVQRVRPSDLNKNTAYFEERIDTNMSMLSSKGVIVNAALPNGTILSPVNGNYLYNGGTTIGVYGLLAYDEYGKYIEIPQNYIEGQGILPTEANLAPNSNGQLVNQGGTFLTNTTYTIVVRWDEKFDETQKAINDKTKIPTNYIKFNSYNLYARTTSIFKGDVILGTVTTDNSGNIVIDESNRDVFNLYQDLITADVSLDSPIAGSTDVTLSSHINMLGSGTWSTTNPHALSAEDIGIDPTATGKHQQYLHSNGIKTNETNSQASALYPSYFSTSGTSNESLSIKGLSSTLNEIVVVNGITITPADLGTDYTFNFTTLNSDTYAGYYIFGVNSSKAIDKYGPFSSEEDAGFVSILNDKTIFPICSFYWGKSLYPLYNITLALTTNTSQVISGIFSSEYQFINAAQADPSADDYYIKAKDLTVYNYGSGSQVIYNGLQYNVTAKTTVISDSNNYDIDQLSFKDRRTFNNTGFDDIRTDTLCAIRDSAPFVNNTVDIYYARLTAKGPFSTAVVENKTFTAIINGQYFSYTFTAASPYTCYQIVDTFNAAFTTEGVSAKAFVDHNNCLNIVATESIVIGSPGTFNEAVGFITTSFVDYGDDIKVIFNNGDLTSRQEIYYNESGDVEAVYYITQGNYVRSHEMVYSGDSIVQVNERVEVK